MTEATSPLRDTHVVIIGGTSGIGLATAHLCLERGARVTVAGRDAKRRAEAERSLHGASGGRVSVQPLDFTKGGQVRRFFRRIETLDHLVVTAAQGTVGPFAEMRERDFKAVFNKLWGQSHVVQCALPHLASEGSITLFSSIVSRRAHIDLTAMGAINAAIESLVRGLAFELAPRRVNGVCPGVIDTPVHDSLGAEAKAQWYRDVENNVPLRRVGTARDVAEATVHLMENSYASGVILPVDGGQLLL